MARAIYFICFNISTTSPKPLDERVNQGYAYILEWNIIFSQIPENLLIALALETNLTNIIDCDKRKYHFTAWGTLT